MRLRPLASAAVALALAAGLASSASAGDPAGRVYLGSDVASLKELVEGLGYEPRVFPEYVSFDVTRTDGHDLTLGIEVRLLVSKGGSKLQLVVPLYTWQRRLDAVESPRLATLLQKSFDLAPTRFWLADAGKDRATVGLQRTIDNRAVRPQDVREQIDALYYAASATRDLWDEGVWK